MTDTAEIRVDIISDIVCPWCIIGYRQLTTALEEMGDEVRAAIHWHPFQLNPSMPEQGQDIDEHMQQKYGTSPEQRKAGRDRLKQLGEKLGFPFSYSPDMRIYNTFKGHQLLHWAGETFGTEAQTRLKLAFFSAYFQDNRNIGDEEVLLDIVETTGLDPEEGRDVINDPANEAAVKAHLDFWTEQGVSGVPAIIIDRQYMVPGAQEAATFVQVIRKAIEKSGDNGAENTPATG